MAYRLGDFLEEVPGMKRLGRAIVMSGATDRYMFLRPNETWRMKCAQSDDDERD